jgi:hypothetical protein
MKKSHILFSISFFLLLAFTAAFSFARAENDDEEDAQPAATVVPTTTSTPSTKSSNPKTVTKTIIVQPEKIVTSTVMQDVQIPDSDRDGLPDETDPHPNIAEQLIVQDTNLDGIDDRYELQSQ